jgi:hypothetical protein
MERSRPIDRQIEKERIFLNPAKVVEEAMAKIQEDGSIKYFDERINRIWTVSERLAAVDPYQNDTVYESELLWISKIIASSSIKFSDERGELRLGRLAVHLCPYRTIPEFINEAVSIIPIDRETKKPIYPTKIPEGWVPPSQRHESTPS